MTLTPTSFEELTEVVRSTPRLLAIGSGTKPRLSAVAVPKVSLRGLNGIVEYEPSEFTFTALAGTPVRDIVTALEERGQYLPFDPMLVEAGSTIGGTVASGLSGPGRFRYGGLRDFILSVKFIDGMGRMLRLGGKVVKNAAGFDVPKFMVGSLGRFGVLVEMTFKVFPKPETTLTIELPFDSAKFVQLSNSRYELAALDVLPGGNTVLARLAGPRRAIEVLVKEIGGAVVDNRIWKEICETPWSFKADMIPEQVGNHKGAHVSSGGNVAFSHTPLKRGLALRGDSPLWIGGRTRFAIEEAVKQALDPEHRFPTLEE